MGTSVFLLCTICGRIVEEHVAGRGPLSCCGREMVQLTPNSRGPPEDHTPRVYPEESGVVIEVGLIPHDMNERNRILWVEVIKEGSQRLRYYLDFSLRPEASFRKLDAPFTIRALCSEHGLWEYSHEPIELEVSEAVMRAVDKYNSLRGRESFAIATHVTEKMVKIEFSGNFCRTCGFFDYFEDFRQILEEFGVKSTIKSIEELDEGAFVTYSIEGD